MNDPRGSVWRKWDLHVHTPASYNFKGKRFFEMDSAGRDATVKQIIENINKSETSVYAINDYWTFDGYFILRAAQQAGESLIKTVFPAIELRIESACKHRLNIHLIFSDKVSDQQLKDFKSHLKLRITGRPLSDEALAHLATDIGPDKAKEHGAKDGYLEDPAQCYMIGAQIAEVTKASFEEALKTIPEEMRLVMLPYDCYGGAEAIDWKKQPIEDQYFLTLGDIIETRDAENIDLFAGRKTAANEKFLDNFVFAIGKRPKPCVSGSDGHSVADFLNWRKETRHKQTWIKADPTFEGLRQITFEPVARVRVQEADPSKAFTKPFFNRITINSRIPVFVPNPAYESPSFDAHPEIQLNSDLVCIIGGRGTGKSCLVDYLRNSFGGSPRKEEYVYSPEFTIVFNKDLTSTIAHNAQEGAELPFVYISQSEVKSKITEGTVGSEIKQMLGVQELAFDLDVDTKVSELLGNVSTHEGWFEQKNEKGELINDEDEAKRQLGRFESLLTSITTEQNKEKLERFTANVTSVASLKEKTKKLTAFSEELRTFQVKANTAAQSLDQRIPNIDFTAQLDVIKTLVTEISEQVAKCEADNERIRADFAQVYTGDLAGLLQNAESYRNSIEKLRSRLTEINRVKTELALAKEARKRVSALLLRELNRQKKEIDRKWKSVREGQAEWGEDQRLLMKKILSDRKIALQGRIVFKADVFMSKLKEALNLRFFKAGRDSSIEEKIREVFPITDRHSFFEFMRDRLHEVAMEEYVSGELVDLFYDLEQRSSYLFVEPQISYSGNPLERLSVGQKGTVYLCLKLATQAFSQPLIFDQPEDDLDNEFIIAELVGIFRGIKQFRQVIVVTHNANLVVNADAEQVVVAQNDGGVLQYTSGSLENEPTNKAIRRILEGGDEAFRKRELRYNLPD